MNNKITTIDYRDGFINFLGHGGYIFPCKIHKSIFYDEIYIIKLEPFFYWNYKYFEMEGEDSFDLYNDKIRKYIDVDVKRISKEEYEKYKEGKLHITAYDKVGNRLWEIGEEEEDKEYDKILVYGAENWIRELNDFKKLSWLASRNIIAFNRNGEQLWQIKTAKEVVGGSDDGSYINMEIVDGNLWCWNWADCRLILNVKTGEVLEKVFTK